MYAAAMLVLQRENRARWLWVCGAIGLAGLASVAVYSILLNPYDRYMIYGQGGVGGEFVEDARIDRLYYFTWLRLNLSTGVFVLALAGFLLMLKREGRRNFILAESMPREVAATYELDQAMISDLIGDAFATLWNPDWEAIRVMALSPKDSEQVWVDIVVDAQPLRQAMLDYMFRILLLSLVLAGITASLIYLSIHFLLVRPMRQMTQSLVGFQRDPDDSATDVRVSRRRDEIGVAQRELSRLQEEVRQSMRRQARLAAFCFSLLRA